MRGSHGSVSLNGVRIHGRSECVPRQDPGGPHWAIGIQLGAAFHSLQPVRRDHVRPVPPNSRSPAIGRNHECPARVLPGHSCRLTISAARERPSWPLDEARNRHSPLRCDPRPTAGPVTKGALRSVQHVPRMNVTASSLRPLKRMSLEQLHQHGPQRGRLDAVVLLRHDSQRGARHGLRHLLGGGA